MAILLDKIIMNNRPIDYVADDKLIKAVEISIALGKPLLVSGEPGTGKTKLADYVAAQLHLQTKGQPNAFLPDPLIFNTKSTSVSTDLFYFYDAVSHFRSQHADVQTEQFIELAPLGLAIAQTHGADADAVKSLRGIRNVREGALLPEPASSVVLIDEVDKAPREFPNDLLNEMENYQFTIRELNKLVRRAKNDANIIVILTSNSEKNLPNAFLRRCVFYHIEFPDKSKLLEIARKRLTIDDPAYDKAIENAIDRFNEIRQKAMNKKPSTSEFLDWINLLKANNLLNTGTYSTGTGNPLMDASMGVLIKNFDDQKILNT